MSAVVMPNPPNAPRQSPVKPLKKAKAEHIPNSAISQPSDETFGNKVMVSVAKATTVGPTNDFLPEEVLFALTQPPSNGSDKMGPVSRYRNINTSSIPSRKPPANVWNHKRSDKLKHLTENTLCLCGAGRDISFLYDMPNKLDEEEVKVFGGEDTSRMRKEMEPPKSLQLPNSLVPEEYHVVKSKGVMGLEYHQSDFTTVPEDHESHLVVFPSMKPTSRYEVAKLKETMEHMLDKAGVNDEEVEYKGPTQMHNLIELIKKEQKIYNIVFHELIRQVTVECSERGELLAELRLKYSGLLSKVPRQIKSLHEEVMAQRALDRRLTEELLRFKSQISTLTSELSEVKEHDKFVTEQAMKTQEDLHSALEESQRNASLLNEYHELYELQRMRLEKIVTSLGEEKELWSSAAYSLAIKVIEESGLATAKRLHVAEKGWSKLAHHFTVLLGDKDTEVLTRLQMHIETWLDQMKAFDIKVKALEDELRTSLKKIRSSVEQLISEFRKNSINKDGQFVKGPDLDGTRAIYNEIKDWSKKLQVDVDLFSGMPLLSNNDSIAELEAHVQSWTEYGVEVFGRHKKNGAYPPDFQEMKALNEKLQLLFNQYSLRITGENGVVKGMLSLCSVLESWENKLVNSIHASQAVLLRDWMTLYEHMNEWVVQLDQITHVIGSTEPALDKRAGTPRPRMDVHELMQNAHMWSVSANSGIDSEDSKMIEQVSSLHTAMVKWMVNMLLHLAPDKPGTSEESRQVALLMSPPIPLLLQEARALFGGLDNFSILVFECCEAIVKKRVHEKQMLMEDGADKEINDLALIKMESHNWIHTANLMLNDLAGEIVEFVTAGSQLDPALQAKLLALHAAPSAASSTESELLTEATQTQPTASELLSADSQSQPEPGMVSEKTFADAPSHQSKVVDNNAALLTLQTGETTTPELDVSIGSFPAVVFESASGMAIVPSMFAPEQRLPSSRPSSSSQQQPDMHLEKIQVIGHDLNTRLAAIAEPNPPQILSRPLSGKKTEEDETKRYEAFVTVEKLQSRLLDTEERAMVAENRAYKLELELKAALESVRSLERRAQEVERGGTNGRPAAASSAAPGPLAATATTVVQPQDIRVEGMSEIPAPGASVPRTAASRPRSASSSAGRRPSSSKSNRK